MAITLVTTSSGYNLQAINDNFSAIQSALNNNIIWRTGSTAGEAQLSRDLDMNGYSLLNLAVDLDDSGSLITVGAADARYVNVDGDAMTGPLAMGSNKVTGLANGTADTDAATFGQLEDEADYRTAADASLQAQISGATPVLIEERPVVQYHSNTLANSFVIPDEMNAFSIGPQITINPGQTVTLGENSYWNILGNVFEADELYNVTANNLITEDGNTTVPVSSIVVASDLTAYAPLASPALTGTPTAPTATAGTSTTQVATTAFVRTGVTDASNATAGTVGEVLTAQTATAVTMTTGTTADLVSLTLSPGDWDLSGLFRFDTSTAAISIAFGSHSTVSGTLQAFPNAAQISGGSSSTNLQITLPTIRVNITASTTYYLPANATFASGTVTGRGYLYARRCR